MQDVHLLEKLAHFNRERIPERIVHAKGAGAYARVFYRLEVVTLPLFALVWVIKKAFWG